MTNLVRAGLARLTTTNYEPWPTAYDRLFPNGTLLTAPTRPAPPVDPGTIIVKPPEADRV